MIILGYPVELQTNMRKTVKKLLLYPIVLILAVGPIMVFVSLQVLANIDLPFNFLFLIGIPLGLVGLVNAIIFYLQQRSAQGLQASVVVLEDINNNSLSDSGGDSFETVEYNKFNT